MTFYPERFKIGKEAEDQARQTLTKLGFSLTAPDWLGKMGKDYYQFEIKWKAEPFKAPPYDGHGFDLHQIKRRLDLEERHKLICVVMIFEKNGRILWQYLRNLEAKKHFDTKNSIRIYDINSYEVLK